MLLQSLRYLITGKDRPVAGAPPAPPAAATGDVETPPPSAEHRYAPAIIYYKGEPVTVYPENPKAARAIPPELLVESQSKLIRTIRNGLDFNPEQFDELVMPVFRQYAEFVHLLPASETNHHSGHGGLFRHGLEVAANAVIASGRKRFAADAWPSRRVHLVARWRLCTMLAGLFHDLGKPVLDVGALDATGSKMWIPAGGSLWNWLLANQLQEYFIHWRPGPRHKRHESISNLMVLSLIPPKTRDWILDHGGDEAFAAMTQTLAGSQDPTNPLNALVREADSASCEADVNAMRKRLSASGQGGRRSIALGLIRAMHNKIEANEWRLNNPGCPIFLSQAGLYGLMPAAVISAIEILRGDGETSIPTDPSKALQMLLDAGFIEPNVAGDGTEYLGRRAIIHLNDRGRAIKLKDVVFRFTSEDVIPSALVRPAPLLIEFPDDDQDSAGTQAKQAQPSLASGNDPQPSDTVVAIRGRTEPTLGDLASTPSNHSPAGEGGDITEQPRSSAPAPPSDAAEVASTAKPQTSVSTDDVPLRDRSEEGNIRDEDMDRAFEELRSEWPPRDIEAAEVWLPAQGDGGHIIQTLAQRIARGELRTDVDFSDDGDRFHIRYPEGLKGLGRELADIRETLEKLEWIERDLSSPGSATVQALIGGGMCRAVRLSIRPSYVLRMYVPQAQAEGTHAPEALDAPQAAPRGPYIDARLVDRFRSFEQFDPADTPLLRPPFQAYLEQSCQDQGVAEKDLKPEDIQALMRRFQRAHKVQVAWLQTHLTVGDNPILLEHKKRAPGSRVPPWYINPGYDLQKDLAV